MTSVTTLRVHGTPAPQGSKKAMPIYRGSKRRGTRQFTGKVNLVEQTHETLDPWRQAVVKQARAQFRGTEPLDGDLSVAMVFALARGKSVRRPYPSVTPDISKLARAVEDALTDAKVWADDARVVRYHELAKVYAGGPYLDLEGVPELDRPGVWVEIRLVGAVPFTRRIAPRQGRPDPVDVQRLRTFGEGGPESLSELFGEAV